MMIMWYYIFIILFVFTNTKLINAAQISVEGYNTSPMIEFTCSSITTQGHVINDPEYPCISQYPIPSHLDIGATNFAQTPGNRCGYSFTLDTGRKLKNAKAELYYTDTYELIGTITEDKPLAFYRNGKPNAFEVRVSSDIPDNWLTASQDTNDTIKITVSSRYNCNGEVATYIPFSRTITAKNVYTGPQINTNWTHQMVTTGTNGMWETEPLEISWLTSASQPDMTITFSEPVNIRVIDNGDELNNITLLTLVPNYKSDNTNEIINVDSKLNNRKYIIWGLENTAGQKQIIATLTVTSP